MTSHRFSRKWNQKLQENTLLILLVTGIRWQIIMYKSQQSNTSRIQRTEQASLFCFSSRFFIFIFYFSIAYTLSGLTLPQINFINEFLVRISYSNFLFPISYFLFPISYFLFPISYFLFPVSCFLFPVSYFLFPISCSNFLFRVFGSNFQNCLVMTSEWCVTLLYGKIKSRFIMTWWHV